MAIALWLNPSTLGQRSHTEHSKKTSNFPRSLLEQEQPNRQVQTAADSVRNRDRAPISKPTKSRPAPTVQGLPSGIDCDHAPRIVIHDDGTVENGYGDDGPGFTVIYADKFTPAGYPSMYTSVCVAFSRLCVGPTSYPIEIALFADDGPGGSPGTELGALPVTITDIPIFPDPTPVWNSFDITSLNIVVNAGSVYIGVRWSGQSFADPYLSADENGPGSGDGYFFDTLGNTWVPISTIFPLYRAMFVRAVEQPADQFVANSTTSIVNRSPTNQSGNRNTSFSGNYAAQGCPNQYVIAQGSDRIVPGDTNIGSDCDECDTFIPLPFNFQLYGATYAGVNVSSNGRLDFVNANEPGGFITSCLPSPPSYFTGLPYDNTIFALWQDEVTTAGDPGCASFPGGVCGVFTSVTGSAPNRIFNIEWRTSLHDDTAPQNFEVRLYENDPNQRFDVIIGTLTPAFFFTAHQWVSGVQGNGNLGFYTEDFCICPPDLPQQNVSRTYTLTPCATPSPTFTPTPTATTTPTATPTATATVSTTPTATPRPTPTPRSSPAPRPRPTPVPRP